MVASKPYIRQIFLRTAAVEADPQVGPRIILIRLVEGLHFWLDQETLTGCQLVLRIADLIASLPFEDQMDQIVGADSRSEAVQRFAFCIAAVTQIEFRKFSVFQCEYICVFHTFSFLTERYFTALSPA